MDGFDHTLEHLQQSPETRKVQIKIYFIIQIMETNETISNWGTIFQLTRTFCKIGAATKVFSSFRFLNSPVMVSELKHSSLLLRGRVWSAMSLFVVFKYKVDMINYLAREYFTFDMQRNYCFR